MKLMILVKVLFVIIGAVLFVNCQQQNNNNDQLPEQATDANFGAVVAKHEYVLVNFYADWCHFCQMLKPIYIEAYQALMKDGALSQKVSMVAFDCVAYASQCSAFQITKYPTIKLYHNGQPIKTEYRGSRTVNAILDYLKEQSTSKYHTVKSSAEIIFSPYKRYIIAQLKSPQDEQSIRVFSQIAASYKDYCEFYLVSLVNDEQNSSVYFFDNTNKKKEVLESQYWGDGRFADNWANTLCVPLIQELTFMNAEQFTEEGKPFLMLFYDPDQNSDAIKAAFKEAIERELKDKSNSLKFLYTNGKLFQHPLMHIGKSTSDLPLIILDSFSHMYLLPHPAAHALSTPSLLQGFIRDFDSGKLHREFHNGPDPSSVPVTMVASQFKKLAPSSDRYSLLKDEL